jgi:ankyrin repeat protein
MKDLKTQLTEAVERGNWEDIDLSQVTSKLIEAKHAKFDGNLLHFAAWQKTLDKVPKAFVKEEYLLQQDSNLNTVIHVATLTGTINALPQKFLTQENLAIENNRGWNVLHMAALSGSIVEIPKEAISRDLLTRESIDSKQTPLDCAISGPLDEKKREGLKTIVKFLKERDIRRQITKLKNKKGMNNSEAMKLLSIELIKRGIVQEELINI